MTFRARQPGCPCCDDDCRIDITGWTQSAGTWTITGDNLETASSSALAVTTNEHPEDKSTHYLSVDIKGASAGDILRLVVAYNDSNNYLYGEIEIDGTAGYMRLFQVLSGVTTQLGDDYPIGGLSGLNADVLHQALICYDGTYLTLTLPDFSSYVQEVTATGTRVGVATGSIGSLATFSDIKWYILYDDGGYYGEPNNCPDCYEIITCRNCENDKQSQVYKVVVDGLADTDGYCNCPGRNGTYLIPHSIECLNFIDVEGICPALGGGLGTDRLTLVIDPTFAAAPADPYKIELRIRLSAYPTTPIKFAKTYSSKPDCLNLDNEEFTLTDAGPTQCDKSSATVKVTSL